MKEKNEKMKYQEGEEQEQFQIACLPLQFQNKEQKKFLRSQFPTFPKNVK